MLKTLWDMIELVCSSFADWNTTLWSDINVENMEMDCKKFVKDIRSLDKEMRAWNAFTGDFAEGRGGTAEPGHQRQTLGAAHAGTVELSGIQLGNTSISNNY